MRSVFQPKWGGKRSENAALRIDAEQLIRLRGRQGKPDPPTGLMAQSGSRMIVLTWNRPERHDNIVGWNVYKNTESELYLGIKNKGQRLVEIPANSGATPPTVNLFVSSVTASGAESVKVQVQGAAKAEAGAPTNPPPPPEFKDIDGGGGDSSDGGVGVTDRGERIGA